MKLEWEFQEQNEDGNEFWICGETKKKFGKVWTFLADVFIDNLRNRSEIEFDVFTLPRHIVEDMEWKSLNDAIQDLKRFTKEMEKLNKLAKLHSIEIFSDNFVGFKTNLRMKTSARSEIEKEIWRVRQLLKI